MNQDGATALMMATFGGEPSTVSLLLDRRFDVNLVSHVRHPSSKAIRTVHIMSFIISIVRKLIIDAIHFNTM
jgi:hypothetical protein